jgi:hypothetical protein
MLALQNTNYAGFTFIPATFTINPKTVGITVTAANKSKMYATNDPALTYTSALTSGSLVSATVDGIAINDTLSSVVNGQLSRVGVNTLAGEQAGTYTITQGSIGASANYSAFTFVPGTLTITPRRPWNPNQDGPWTGPGPAPTALTVVADSQSIKYRAADPVFTYTVSGLVDVTLANGVVIHDTVASALGGALSRVSGTMPGAYAINLGSLAPSANYASIVFTPATLTIGPMPETAPVILPGIIQQLAADEGDGDNNFYSADWSSFASNKDNCSSDRPDALISMSTPGASDETVLAAINSNSMVKQELPGAISAMINNASLSSSAVTGKTFASESIDMTTPGILNYKLSMPNGQKLPSWVKFDANSRMMTLVGSAPDKKLPLTMRLSISRGANQIIESVITVKPIEGGACTAQTASK